MGWGWWMLADGMAEPPSLWCVMCSWVHMAPKGIPNHMVPPNRGVTMVDGVWSAPTPHNHTRMHGQPDVLAQQPGQCCVRCSRVHLSPQAIPNHLVNPNRGVTMVDCVWCAPLPHNHTKLPGQPDVLAQQPRMCCAMCTMGCDCAVVN